MWTRAIMTKELFEISNRLKVVEKNQQELLNQISGKMDKLSGTIITVAVLLGVGIVAILLVYLLVTPMWLRF